MHRVVLLRFRFRNLWSSGRAHTQSGPEIDQSEFHQIFDDIVDWSDQFVMQFERHRNGKCVNVIGTGKAKHFWSWNHGIILSVQSWLFYRQVFIVSQSSRTLVHVIAEEEFFTKCLRYLGVKNGDFKQIIEKFCIYSRLNSFEVFAYWIILVIVKVGRITAREFEAIPNSIGQIVDLVFESRLCQRADQKCTKRRADD